MTVVHDRTAGTWTCQELIRGELKVFSSRISEAHLLELVEVARKEPSSYEKNAVHFEKDPFDDYKP